MKQIHIRGARQHNLRNIDLDIPRDRLTVITGVSGSGKSSLAFDTIFAEGQRRYLEALSGRRRQYLQALDKPDVDEIIGISPAIAIEQKRVARNPRSTVGTLTEIHDLLRVLFARAGTLHCPKCGQAVIAYTVPGILQEIGNTWSDGSRLLVLAPLEPILEKGLAPLIARLRKEGFARIRLDGRVIDLDPPPHLPRRPSYPLEVVVDRIVFSASRPSRLVEDIELALKYGGGILTIADTLGTVRSFSDRFQCTACKIDMAAISPSTFSFHHPQGICPHCNGLGSESATSKSTSTRRARGSAGESPESMTGKASRGRNSHGLEERELTAPDDPNGGHEVTCAGCGGSRLNPMARSVRIHGLGIHEVSDLPLNQLSNWLPTVPLSASFQRIAAPLISEILQRAATMDRLGLGYLCLSRSAVSLSGGEAQRVRLAQQIGSQLTGILYVLDEPSIGLHPQDHHRLMKIIRELRDAGNTVIVVEHDRETILEADHVIDMGPGAGALGGQVVFSGTPRQLVREASSLTGQYLSGRKSIEIPRRRAPFSRGSLGIRGATGHNLKDIDVDIPLGCITCVTGVSGSGKSTLVLDTLHRALAKRLYRATSHPAPHRGIEGLSSIRKVHLVDQSAIGKNPRSTPATYTGLLTHIRQLFARLPEARARGYGPDRFSYNVKGGRCESCRGDGSISVDLVFLPDVTFTCPLCNGSRYNPETLQILFKGHSIAEVLSMSVTEALMLLENVPSIRHPLEVLQEVGLGYLMLGQSALTLSGGESQRVKLASELSLRSSEPALFILDEPTTGLHFDDISQLMHILQRLADAGHTIVLIEHHLDVIKSVDYVIDLGPGGGDAGGKVVAVGSPEEVAAAEHSVTGRFLRKSLPQSNAAGR
ncbi:MAG: excinuclease ABC subunit UvrA [Syntrophobacteraceae bacterium]|jgi:excinuclease ABC subunit A|nr:excinuclease ABC subunit UvrA [Syntrophobacteraceae bacterium]